MDIFRLHEGTTPLLVSLPHDGTHLPEKIAARMTPTARRVPDTDWHTARLYAFAHALGASVIQPFHSRYVADLNRPPDDHSLYPGQNTTSLCPTEAFSGEALYLPGQAPSGEEIAERRQLYWQPYHDALQAELERLKARFGRVVLWDGHSIRGRLPYLFDGQLPDLNLGTAEGKSCRPELQARLEERLVGDLRWSQVSNGRFKGGYITRHYGRPDDGVDAIQLELVQDTYMDEQSTEYLPGRAQLLQQGILKPLLETVLEYLGD